MNIIYKDNNVDVDLEINDNVTIIAGDSGTGKTYLFNRLKIYPGLDKFILLSIKLNGFCV